MADLTVTAANVSPGTGANPIRTKSSGEAITAGESVYVKSSDDKVWRADADAAASAAAVGIAVNSTEGADQPVAYMSEDANFDPGATVVVGEVYVVSTTAGGIAPKGDLSTGDYTKILGIGKTASTIDLNAAAFDAHGPIA